MPRARLTRLIRQLAQPLSAALVVAAMGVATAFVVLALRGHFNQGVAGTPAPLALATPTPSQPSPSVASSPTPLPSGPQQVTGTLTAGVVIPLSSDEANGVRIPAGTSIQATVAQQGGQVVVVDLVAGSTPPGKGKHKNSISGSTATTTIVTVATSSGSMSLTIVQDSAVKGTDGATIALHFSGPGP